MNYEVNLEGAYSIFSGYDSHSHLQRGGHGRSGRIRFNQLHKDDNGPVGYDKKCKKCGKVLTTEEIVKGYPFEPEQYVIVSPEDFEKLRLKSMKVIEIEGFIDATEVHPSLYESPYFAGPDGAVAAKTYSLCINAKGDGFNRSLQRRAARNG